MRYAVVVRRGPQKVLASVPGRMRDRLEAAMMALGDDPRPPGCKKLADVDAWRIRVGEYRVVYEVADVVRIVTVVKVGHRRDVYR